MFSVFLMSSIGSILAQIYRLFNFLGIKGYRHVTPVYRTTVCMGSMNKQQIMGTITHEVQFHYYIDNE